VKTLILLTLLGASIISGEAQPPAIEFANGSGPTTSGSTLADQVITFQNNSSNPTAFTFSPYTPTLTATFSISDQQYTLLAPQSPNGGDLSFGGNLNTGTQMIGSMAQFGPMSAISSAPSDDFTSTNYPGQANEGISVTSNYASALFTSTLGLYNAGASTSGTYKIANLTITFSSPVANPVIQIVGLGGTFGSGRTTLGFTTQLTLLTTGVTLSELSGSPEFEVTPTQILNSAAQPTSVTGSGAASGSVLVTGSSITQLVFEVDFRGDGGGATWANVSTSPGDAWLIGVSAINTIDVLPLTITSFTATPQGGAADLNWTAPTTDIDHFGVQSSPDGLSWRQIGEVSANASSQSYQFVDQHPAAGNNFYRLVEVASNGAVVYSDVKQVNFSLSSRLSFYPNPVRDRVTINSEGPAISSVTVLSIDGRTLQQNPAFNAGQSISLGSYPSGIYLLQVKYADGTGDVVKIEKD
jgi:hypothetical protein